MRQPKYLSPSSLACFYNDRTAYYLRYLADNRPPREKQTKPMAVGSAFDAYVKAHLEKCLFGKELFEELFESQVEEHNRDWAREAGKHVFDAYRVSGALKDLLIELQQSKEPPVFEGTINEEVNGVPLLGKPDVFFINKYDAHIIFDWKVNGYCSKRGVSPKKGYVDIRDGWEGQHSRSHRTTHKDAQVLVIDGISVNVASYFEEVDSGWANQLCIYAWTLGEAIGSNFVIGIDQIVARPPGPKLRIASHRGRVSREYQEYLFSRAKDAWKIIKSGHIFDDESLEKSNKRCRTLDEFHKAYEDPDFSAVL